MASADLNIFPSLGRTAPAPRSADPALVTSTWLVLGVVAAEIVAQVLLLFPFADRARVPLRAFPFVTGLFMCFVIGRRNAVRLHPAAPVLVFVLLLMGINLCHPYRNTLTASVAAIALYAAVMSPLLWVGRCAVDERLLKRVATVFWLFALASAAAGVVQTVRPDWTWLQPNLSLVVQNFNDGGEGLKISLANGATIFRPMGLSDQPGGAALAGLMCVVFGIALATASRRPLLWIAVVAGWFLGVFCILMSQVRSVLVMCGVCVIAYSFIMSRRGEFGRLIGVLTTLGVAVTLAVVAAVAVGGETVTSRLQTLIAEDPATVYMTNRGLFMEYTLKYVIWEHPLGAGLGRWGMMNYYFGNPADPSSETLWAEIMWTGWVYDGGIPLALTYGTAIVIALRQAWRIGVDRRNGLLGQWGALIFAYNIACLAVTFNCPYFMSQGGADFWLINAALFAAEQHERARHAPRVPAAAAAGAIARPSLPTSILGMHT
jgi:hypothetical protein